MLYFFLSHKISGENVYTQLTASEYIPHFISILWCGKCESVHTIEYIRYTECGTVMIVTVHFASI